MRWVVGGPQWPRFTGCELSPRWRSSYIDGLRGTDRAFIDSASGQNARNQVQAAIEVNELLSSEHLLTLGAIAVVSGILVVISRRWQGWWIKVFAVTLVVVEASWWAYVAAGGVPGSRLAQSLPLQLCDVGTVIAAAALWTRRPILVELTYFWGLAGTIQALLWPDLPQPFPTYPYFQYYLAHGGVIAAALVLVIGLGLRPRRNAVFLIAGLTLAYTAFVGLVDAVAGANYMYLRAKPPSPTLLDVMGPWPWYIASAAVIGAVLFAILDAPFRLLTRPSMSPPSINQTEGSQIGRAS
jgi:hypothetical integral membrane protein (TIGR02206 family)